ncbi:hypothetical protein HID58_025376 [Brassica napus]|uniref:Uncharacterized protein n=1 Tax=Brassica napus TaxID=3708 RepID=A0ABQ8CKX2_BRANA|nr:hypothetical protein HID58_025376 [Brassica napus]
MERLCDLSLRLGISSKPPSTSIDVVFSRAYQGRSQKEELCLFSEVKQNDNMFDWLSIYYSD